MNGREFWGPHQFTEMHGALTRISLFLSFFCSPPVWFTDFTAGISPLLCVCCEVKSADVLMALSVSVTCMSLVVEYLASSRALLVLSKDSTFVCLFCPLVPGVLHWNLPMNGASLRVWRIVQNDSQSWFRGTHVSSDPVPLACI